MERSVKDQQNLRRDISSLLRDFEKNREWADFSHWLHRLLDLLGNRKCSFLPQSLTLAKRLAQCLNPSLPAGVHSTALKVYQTLLNNFGGKTQLLPLMAMGLFPFFEHSNTQNKYAILKLFEDHFITEPEGVQMIVGLTNALLTVLNENSEDQAKRVYSICQSITKNFGRSWVEGAVWVNILKSPKVRLAGFKYFQKVFRDRDRAAQSEEFKISQEDQKLVLQEIEKKVEESQLGEEEKVLLTTIYGFKCQPDNNSSRFPNFSSLVVNSLSVCLEVGADNMVKRTALDLLIAYLKLDSGVFGKKEGVLILERMLLLLQSKEYSLTNRVYKYLFGQPNSEGFFQVDFQKKDYQLSILKESLSNLLLSNIQGSETVLLIMEILIGDHPLLADFLLQGLAIEIVTFAQAEERKSKKQASLPKTVTDFYLNVIIPKRRIFLPAILKKIPKNKQDIDPLAPTFPFIVDILKFYFSRMEKLGVEPRRKGSEESGDENRLLEESKERVDYLSIRVQTLRDLIEELWSFQNLEEQQSLRILDLCNQLLAEVQICCETKEEGLSQQQISKIQKLLVLQAKLNRKGIYAKLLTLHPKPTKEMLLPYIQDSFLSIVCINLLLGGEKVSAENFRPRTLSASKAKNRLRSSTVRSGSIAQMYEEPLSLTEAEQQAVFFAIFKLLNCHLFEGRALEFIDRFRTWWGQLFVELINQVEPSEWLIYWKKMEGDVAGGILRMVENLNSQNSYHKHLSKKWIGEAENIITKVLDAIYELLENAPQRKNSEQQGKIQFKQLNVQQYQRIFNLVQLVFKFTSIGFTKFFFLQKDKYLAPLVLFVFKCLESKEFTVRSRSLSFLSLIFNQASSPNQKIDLLALTLPNILAILDQIIDHKKVLGVNSSQSQDELLKNSNFEIELLEYISLSIKRVGEMELGQPGKMEEAILDCLKGAKIYEVMLKGITFSDSQYIKNLYIESSKQLSEMLAKIDRSKREITTFISRILDKLFFLLKNTDANRIEAFIKSRNETTLKESTVKRNISSHEDLVDAITAISKESVLETEIKENLNLQEKYGEIIELWNTVKFYLQFALNLELKEIPIANLLSLALTSFPLAYLKYTCVGSQEHANNLEILEQEIQNVTGLKKEVFQIFEILWNKENKEIIDFLIEKGDPRILVHSQLDPSKVMEAFNRSSKMVEVKAYLRPERINLPKNMLHYNIDNLIKENQLLFFIYLYLLYCNFRLLKNRRISTFFQGLLDFLNKLRQSPHVQTKIWMLEVMEVIGHRVVNTKELSIENGNRIRSELQHITRELIEEMQAVITKSKHYTHKADMKTGIFGLFNKGERENAVYDFVKNFPPTICQQFQNYKENIRKNYQIKHEHQEKINNQVNKHNSLEHPRDRLSSYLLQLDSLTDHQDNPIDNFLFGRFVNISQEEFPEYLSYVALRTLIRIGNSVLIALFDDLTKISLIIKEILLNLLPICEKRENSTILMNQLIAEYLHTVLANESLRPEVLKNLKKQIIEVYMANNFFRCTQKTLAHWKAIIDFTIGENNDLLGELLSREGLFEGIFTRKAEATIQKIKSFERVCFIIYAGKVDRYENKLRVVLESLNEVMKQDDAPPALLILILFCIRILLMRLSAISLNKLFKSVWPSLITLLIQIFSREKVGKSMNLQLAALKVVELIHAMELEEFMLHKWIFIFDYFGLKIDPMGEIEDNMPNCQMLSPFRVKPQLTNCFPKNRYRCKFIPEKKAWEGHEVRVKRRLIVKQTYIESEEDLEENALLLMQYMMDLNEHRCEMSKGDIENLIEDEFISLDNYIFKVK